MHPNPVFRQEPDALNLSLVRARGFGTLCVNADPAPHLAHVPFVLDEEGRAAEFHLMRANPVARAGSWPVPAVLSVMGPDGYVSPDWYDDPAQVPTWNYVAVHLRGMLEPLPDAELRGHLDRVSAGFETRVPAKAPWTVDKMPVKKLEALMRGIRPFVLRIEAIEGTWKLNQNKTDAARENAAEHMKSSAIGQETAELARLMRGIGASRADG